MDALEDHRAASKKVDNFFIGIVANILLIFISKTLQEIGWAEWISYTVASAAYCVAILFSHGEETLREKVATSAALWFSMLIAIVAGFHLSPFLSHYLPQFAANGLSWFIALFGCGLILRKVTLIEDFRQMSALRMSFICGLASVIFILGWWLLPTIYHRLTS